MTKIWLMADVCTWIRVNKRLRSQKQTSVNGLERAQKQYTQYTKQKHTHKNKNKTYRSVRSNPPWPYPMASLPTQTVRLPPRIFWGGTMWFGAVLVAGQRRCLQGLRWCSAYVRSCRKEQYRFADALGKAVAISNAWDRSATECMWVLGQLRHAF